MHKITKKKSQLAVQILIHRISKQTNHFLFTEKQGYCTAHLINEGVYIEGRKVTIEFSPTGDTKNTKCILNPPKTEGNDFVSC